MLVTGSRDYTLRVWDLDKGVAISVLKGHTGSIYDVAVSPDEKIFGSASSDKTLRYGMLGLFSKLIPLVLLKTGFA